MPQNAAASVRPMLAEDLEPAARVSAAAFSRELNGDPDAARRWRERIAYPWRTDPFA
ncbi:MAG: hypothetical protein ACRDPA_16445 [Solirubrobacteraceae bacterium]